MNLKYILLALMPFCIASCSEEEYGISGGMQREVRVTAGTTPHSRIVLKDNGSHTQTLWQNGDKISLFTATQSNLVYGTTMAENSSVAEFTASGEKLKYVEGGTVYACHPEAASVSEDGKKVNLSSTQTMDYNNGTIRSFGYAEGAIEDGNLNLSFKHISAFISLSVTPDMLSDSTKQVGRVTVTTSSDQPLSVGEGDTFDFSTQTASTTNGTNSVQIDTDSLAIESLWTVYIPVLPQPAGANITLTLTAGDGTTLYTLTKETPSDGFQAGYVYKVGASVSFETSCLVDGPTFNASIKELVNGNTASRSVYDTDSLIAKVEFLTEVETVPENCITVSAEDSPAPIYASFNPADSLLTVFTPAKDIEVVNTSSMFAYLTRLRVVDFGNFDVNETTTNLSSMFYYCSSLSSLDVSNWDISNVTDISYMFSECSSLTSLDVSNWDTSNVTSMRSMFNECSSLLTLDVSNWDTSKVTNMSWMFSDCYELAALDVSKWNTSNVTTMQCLFQECTSLTALDISDWNTEKVTNMRRMFNICDMLTDIDVSQWNTANVTTMYGTFQNCKSLTNLNISNWNTEKVQTMHLMFEDCYDLSALDVSNWNTTNVTDMGRMFGDCRSLTNLNLSNWNTENVVAMDSLFIGCKSLLALDIANWTVNENMDFVDMFSSCASTSQTCEITATQEAQTFLLNRTATTSMNPEWFIWKNGVVDGDGSSFEDMPKEEWGTTTTARSYTPSRSVRTEPYEKGQKDEPAGGWSDVKRKDIDAGYASKFDKRVLTLKDR